MPFYTYILYSQKLDKYYIGSTENPEKGYIGIIMAILLLPIQVFLGNYIILKNTQQEQRLFEEKWR
jgi:hypothetical protein